MGATQAQPLHAACTAGARLLIERGADVNDAVPFKTYTPLHSAAVQGHADVVRVLSAGGADLNADAGNRPALVEAAQWGYVEVVRALLECGADPNVLNDKGQTALWLVVNEPRHGFGRPEDLAECAEALRAHGGRE